MEIRQNDLFDKIRTSLNKEAMTKVTAFVEIYLSKIGYSVH